MKMHITKCLMLFFVSLIISCTPKTKSNNEANDCCEKLKKMEIKNSCANQTSPDVADEDLMLKFDCKNDSTFQHLHIDIKNNIGILGKVDMDDNIMEYMEIRKKEVGRCKDYKLVNGKYVGSIAIDSNKQKMHIYKVEINKNPNGEADNRVSALTNININKNDIIDIFIESDDLNIKSDIPIIIGKETPTTIEEYIELVQGTIVDFEPMTNYGEQFCRSKIIINP